MLKFDIISSSETIKISIICTHKFQLIDNLMNFNKFEYLE